MLPCVHRWSLLESLDTCCLGPELQQPSTVADLPHGSCCSSIAHGLPNTVASGLLITYSKKDWDCSGRKYEECATGITCSCLWASRLCCSELSAHSTALAVVLCRRRPVCDGANLQSVIQCNLLL